MVIPLRHGWRHRRTLRQSAGCTPWEAAGGYGFISDGTRAGARHAPEGRGGWECGSLLVPHLFCWPWRLRPIGPACGLSTMVFNEVVKELGPIGPKVTNERTARAGYNCTRRSCKRVGSHGSQRHQRRRYRLLWVPWYPTSAPACGFVSHGSHRRRKRPGPMGPNALPRTAGFSGRDEATRL